MKPGPSSWIQMRFLFEWAEWAISFFKCSLINRFYASLTPSVAYLHVILLFHVVSNINMLMTYYRWLIVSIHLIVFWDRYGPMWRKGIVFQNIVILVERICVVTMTKLNVNFENRTPFSNKTVHLPRTTKTESRAQNSVFRILYELVHRRFGPRTGFAAVDDLIVRKNNQSTRCTVYLMCCECNRCY